MATQYPNVESAASNSKKYYIRDLPYKPRKDLCSLLDMNDDHWRELGGQYLRLKDPELCRIGRAFMKNWGSPTNDLLCIMDSRNLSVNDLFACLHDMKHFQAMDIIKSFVDPKMHHLLRKSVGLNPDISLEKCREKNANTDFNQHNKENVINNPVQADECTKHGYERTTERKLSDESNVERLDSSIPFIPLHELERATDGWHPSKVLGRGGFGVVFKGYWKHSDIAIKKLESPKKKSAESNLLKVQKDQSLKELKYLNISRHDNILPLFGYSIHDHKYVLVYQYMSNGSLDDCLHKTNAKYLPWTSRHNIAKGTARGLQFLHNMNPQLLHGDIKSANILLDQKDNPKIGDFGLAREGPTNPLTHVRISKVYGTRPYLPYEFIQGKKLSEKVDVYSFGVVLFEIATGKKPFEDARSEKYLRDHVYNYEEDKITNLMDPRGVHENHVYLNLYKRFIKLGKACVDDKNDKNRPKMIEVFEVLNEWYVPDPPPQNWSLHPPSHSIIHPTWSHDPRRSPSPTSQQSRNFLQNIPRANPHSLNVGSNLPPITNQSPRNLTPQLQVLAEVSPSTENVIVQPEDNQKLPPIPNIKLIITSSDKSPVPASNDQIVSDTPSSDSTPESEPSTHYTDTSNSNETLETRSSDRNENKESIISSNSLPIAVQALNT